MEGSNFIITIFIAFIGGLLSFLSPCVLPLVPGYISLISGVSIDRLKDTEGSESAARRAVIVNSLAFNAGLSLIFLTLGAAAGLVGASITSNPWVRIIGGLVIIAFGFQLMGVLKISALYRDTRRFSEEKPRGPLGSLTLGMAFAAGWTPCIGPILGGIIGLAATSGGWKSGLVLSAFYAAGLAVPFLITGLGINQFLGFYARFRQHLHKVEVVSGIILILIGALVATGYSTRLASSNIARLMPNVEQWFDTKVKNKPGASQASQARSSDSSAAVPAPDVEFRTLEGQPYHLSDLRGRVVLLNFWATWCLPCRAEITELNKMQHELQDRGLAVVGVSVFDEASDIKQFDIKQDYMLLTGNEEVKAKFEGVPSVPTTYIIDREGRIRQKIIGARDRADFEAVIKPLLDEPPMTTARRD